MTVPTRWRAMSMPSLIAVLLVLSGALFGIGVALERGSGSGGEASASATPTGSTAPSETTEHSEATEHSETTAGSESAQSSAGHTEAAGSERVLGVALESPTTVVVALLVSLLLAVLVWSYPRRPVLIAVILVAAGAVVFDIAEVARQFNAARAGVGAVAIMVAGLHIAVVAAAAVLLRSAQQSAQRSGQR